MTRTDTANNQAAIAAETLLIHYSFDLSHCTAEELINQWLKDYPSRWLRLAIVEALYQGRYKSISVEQILACWHRRSKPIYHFNLEFEQLICSQLPGANLEDIQDQEVKYTGEDTVSREDAAAENTEATREDSVNISTNNPPITPITKDKKNELTQELADTSASEKLPKSHLITEKLCAPVLIKSLEKSQPVKSAICSDLPNQSTLEENPSTPSSNYQIKNQIITELLEDPWLDDRDQETLESPIDSELNHEMSVIGSSPTSESEHADPVEQDPASPIHEFTPNIEESSEFYVRLKGIIENKLKHPEEQRPKKRFKKQQ